MVEDEEDEDASMAASGVQFNRHLRTALTSVFTLALTHSQKTLP